jgi:hypothetical protein
MGERSTKKIKIKHQGPIYVDRPEGKTRGLIGFTNIQKMAREISTTLPKADTITRTYVMSGEILKMFFGPLWFAKFIIGANGPVAFLRPDKPALEGILRLIHLGEMLFNLQKIAGFDEVLDKIAGGAIESAFAELEAGRLLFQYGISFRFVKRQQEKKKDYDVEFFHPNGELVCAETKCKIETTELKDKTILDSLDSARKQLPRDRACALLVNVPQNWFEQPKFRDDFARVAEAFLRRPDNKRIVLIEVFSFMVELRNGGVIDKAWINEFRSANHQFDKSLNWRLLTRYEGYEGDRHFWVKFSHMLSGPYNVAISLG